MKHWLNRHYKTIIVSAFVVPIIIVALVSISHVTIWYGISNPVSWAIYLSVGIEIAALSSLAAISANMGKYVYFPFIIVTLLQLIGNVFFSYNFIDVTSATFKSWVELVSPLLQFMGVDSTDVMGHKRFLALFSGGMLPVISLSFLHMLIKFTEADRLKDLANDDKETSPITEQSIVNEKENTQIDEKELIENVTKINPNEEELLKLEKLVFAERKNKEEENLTEEERLVDDYIDRVVEYSEKGNKTQNLEQFITNPYQGEIPKVQEVPVNESIFFESKELSDPILDTLEATPSKTEVNEVLNDVPQIEEVEQKKITQHNDVTIKDEIYLTKESDIVSPAIRRNFSRNVIDSQRRSSE
jgi:hypothetical protein